MSIPLVKFHTYETIPLKLFIEIAETADYMLLIISGKPTPDESFDQWEQIIQKNSSINGSTEYRSYYDNLKHYNKLLREFNAIKATITILYFEIDNDMVEYLRSKGYKIDLSSSEAYATSLNAAMNRSNNLISKIESRYKAIVKANEQSKGSNQQTSFASLLANLNMTLGFKEDDTLLLATYNEYNKRIKRDNEANKKKK